MSQLTVRTGANSPAPGSREWLNRRTEDVLTLAYRQACDLIRIGAILNDVRATVGRGNYLKWVEERLPFSAPTAHRFRQVATAFAAYQTSQFEMFDPRALYTLAQTTKVPKEARDHAVALVEQGEHITYTKALEIIDANRPVSVTEKELKVYETHRRKLDARKEYNPASGRASTVHPSEELAKTEAKEQREYAALGKLFATAAEQLDAFTVTRTVSAEAGEPDESHTVFYELKGGVPQRRSSSADLRLALEGLLGVQRLKVCRGCVLRFPLGRPVSEFGRNDDQDDGFMPRCRACERERKRVKRRADRAARGTPEPPPPPPGPGGTSSPTEEGPRTPSASAASPPRPTRWIAE